MLFSGIAVTALVVAAWRAGTVVLNGEVRWKKIKELITTAMVATSKATTSAILGERGALTG